MTTSMANSIGQIGWIFVALNVFLYTAKYFLQSRGYKVSWLYSHGDDFVNLKTISTTSSSSSDRAFARTWLLALTLTAVTLVAAAVALIWSAFAI
jgi:hypothetical protein